MDLSVIVVSYNTEELTLKTLDAIQKSLKKTPKLKAEVIVIDNASSDNSPAALKKRNDIKLILSKKNLGFGGGNNLGIKKATGRYTLLLNSDLIADNVDFEHLLDFMDAYTNIGGLTVRVELKNGEIDPASHRGFPTAWRSFCYFTRLEHLTYNIPGLNKIFGGYHLTHLPINETHEIDCPIAAFWLIPTKILKDVGGFDEDFFMYGEDLDLAMRIREEGYVQVYYPKYTVLHLKRQSGLSANKKKIRQKTNYHFYNAMKIFYDKHYAPKNPAIINWLMHTAIDIKQLISRS